MNIRASIKARLENVRVVERRSSMDNVYYIIFDEDKETDNAYFCFDRSLEKD
jgi:hypothetical protein